jgi:hypothetical protein
MKFLIFLGMSTPVRKAADRDNGDPQQVHIFTSICSLRSAHIFRLMIGSDESISLLKRLHERHGPECAQGPHVILTMTINTRII